VPPSLGGVYLQVSQAPEVFDAVIDTDAGADRQRDGLQFQRRGHPVAQSRGQTIGLRAVGDEHNQLVTCKWGQHATVTYGGSHARAASTGRWSPAS
jgi:hypothetical protein